MMLSPLNHKPSPLAGFTLVELSIVLVIVSLLIGGIVAGRMMLKAAEIRQQISQIEQVNVMVAAFVQKYGCLPGDCRTATSFFTATSQPEKVSNGNGNGYIEGVRLGTSPTSSTSWWPNTEEHIKAWDSLAAANLTDLRPFDETSAAAVDQPGISSPLLKIVTQGYSSTAFAPTMEQGGVVFGYEPPYFSNSGGHRIRLGACGWSKGTTNCGFSCGMNPDEAQSVDQKIDDGLPYTGNMTLMAATSYPFRIPGSGLDYTTNCGVSAQNIYNLNVNVSVNGKQCSPSIKALF